MSKIIKVTLRSRPLRYAYLIDPHSTTRDLINSIIRDSLDYWGGRYYGIFPIHDGNISEDWWRILVTLDPDILIAFVPLSDPCLARIRRMILPSRIIGLEDSERKLVLSMPAVSISGVQPLGTYGIPKHAWSRRGVSTDPIFLMLKNPPLDTVEGDVILRNFGVTSGDVFTRASFRDVATEEIDCSQTTLVELIQRVVDLSDRPILPIDLSASFTGFPRRFEHDNFCDAFHLVVGDSTYDVIYGWNRALTSGSSHPRRVFWIPSGFMTNAQLLQVLVAFINRNSWTMGNRKRCFVVSYSLEEADLRKFIQALPDVPWDLEVQPRCLKHNEFPFPEPLPPSMPESSIPLLGHDWHEFSSIRTQQVLLGEEEALLEADQPSFAAGAKAQDQWMVDAQIQYVSKTYNYSNIQPSWTLPRRQHVANLFFPSQYARIVSGGLPSTVVGVNNRYLQLTIPGNRQLFQHLLLNRHVSGLVGQPASSPARFTNISTSAEGDCLRGVFRLCGSLFNTEHVFGDEYWRTVLREMATTRRARQRWRTVRQLQERFGNLRRDALNSSAGDTTYWKSNERFDEWKYEEFTNLVARDILKQGIESQCHHCGSSSWHGSGELGPSMLCVGCGAHIDLSPEAKWAFRINELVAGAVSRGTLPVIQALCALRREAHGMFLALPCQNIFESDENSEYTDIDLVAIADQKLIIGEAKASPERFDQEQCDRICDVAAEILPDELVFAAEGRQWPEEVANRLSAIEKNLQKIDVRVRVLKLAW